MSSLTEISSLYKNLLEIATTEFTNIVESGEVLCSQSNEAWKLRGIGFKRVSKLCN